MKRLSVFLVLIAAAAPLTTPFAGRADGPNLLPNAGFEESALEPAPVPQGTLPQPLLPAGWTFEGLAGLFDHTPNSFHSGSRAAAISIPLSPNDELCTEQTGCMDNPLNPARDALRPVYSISPSWRTLLPVPVQAGQNYRLRSFVVLSVGSAGEGATLSIRWLDATGVPIRQDLVASRIRVPNDPETTSWITVTGTKVAPAGAAQAHVLLGHTEQIEAIGQILFDDVFFGIA